MVRLSLWLLDGLRPLFRLLGVDYGQLRATIQVKLTLDGRRRSGHMQGIEGKDRNVFVWTLFFYAFMGVFVGMVGVHTASPLVGLTIVHAFVMVMVGLSLIADFSSVLLDPTDNVILLPRPIDSRTLLVARVTHVALYLGSLALSISAATLIAGAIVIGWWFVPVFLGTLACSVALVVFFVHVFYLLAMRLMDVERFRDVILYVQMVMTVVVVGAYQILPRLMDYKQLLSLQIDDRWWVYICPPAWMAAPVHLLAGHPSQAAVILTVLAVAVPVLGLTAVVGVLAPGFQRALAQAELNPVQRNEASVQPGRPRSWGYRLSRWVTGHPAERAAFELIWQIASRDRPFKMRTYPTVAFLLLFGCLFLLGDSREVAKTLAQLPETQKFLFLLYFACMMGPTAIFQQKFTTQPEAAWLYYALPLEYPGQVLLGAFKVMAIRFVALGFAAMAILALVIWRAAILGDVLFAACATLLVSALQAWLFARKFPFSEAFGMAQSSGRLGRSVLWMIFPAVLAGFHFVLRWIHPCTVVGAAPLVFILAVLMLRGYGQLTWPALLRASR